MRRVVVAVITAVVISGCASVQTQPQTTTPAWTEPDSSGVLRLFSHDGVAHGCPIDTHHLLTARHVAVDGESRKQAFAIWSDRLGNSGSAFTVDYDLRRDVAIMRSDTPFAHVYQIAAEPPQVNERVVIIGYNFADALSPKIVTVKVLRQVSAHLILTAGGEQGFSGSCVLNSKGETVAIFHWQISRGLDDGYGVASLVTGNWREVGWVPPQK